jgi:molybdopterin/thiamine biosynthesis adenylyltransferase
MHSNQVSFLRHGAFFGPEDASNKTFCIIGAGATGSFAALFAAKMGWHKFQIWDLDLVESHNLPNQTYNVSHIGMKKVDALEKVLLDFNPMVQVEKNDYFFDSNNQEHVASLEDCVFIAVDSLDTRKSIYSSLHFHPFVDIIFETRMGFTHAEMNITSTTDVNKINQITEMLKRDSEVEESACNERIITTLTAIVSSTLVHKLCQYASFERTQLKTTASSSLEGEVTNRTIQNAICGKTIFDFSSNLNIYNHNSN